MPKVVVAIGVVPVLLALLTGCVTQAQLDEQAASESASAHAVLTRHMPKRFTDFGTGLGYDWAGTCNDGGGVCRTIELYAYESCSSIYLEGDLREPSGKYIGVVNGTFDALRRGATLTTQVEWSDHAVTSVHLTHLDCN